eukprot:2177643-Rhodomonas_salina.1
MVALVGWGVGEVDGKLSAEVNDALDERFPETLHARRKVAVPPNTLRVTDLASEVVEHRSLLGHNTERTTARCRHNHSRTNTTAQEEGDHPTCQSRARAPSWSSGALGQ